MNKPKKRKSFNVDFQQRKVPISLIDTAVAIDTFEKKDLKTRAAYIMLNGAPTFAVNEKADGRFALLASDEGIFECQSR